MKRTWEITDLDGSNKRAVTLEQFRVEIEAAKKATMKKLRSDAKASGLEIPARWR